MLVNKLCRYYLNDGEYNDSYNNKAIKEYIEVFYYKKHNTVFLQICKNVLI